VCARGIKRAAQLSTVADHLCYVKRRKTPIPDLVLSLLSSSSLRSRLLSRCSLLGSLSFPSCMVYVDSMRTEVILRKGMSVFLYCG